MRIVWDEAKRRTNLRKHGFDFADAEAVFAGPTYVLEDDRFRYDEQRFISLGLLRNIVVHIVHSDTAGEIRVISMRRPRAMKKRSSSTTSNRGQKSRTEWTRVKAMRDEDIDTSDSPKITADIADKGVWKVNGKQVARGKTRLTMYLDNVLVEYFKARAGPRGYQTLINEALREAIQRETLEGTLRRVLREEAVEYNVTKSRR